MKLVFRSHSNTAEEIKLGHKVGFTTIKASDDLSATANLNGFTHLTAVLRYLGYDKELFLQVAENCKINRNVELYCGDRDSCLPVFVSIKCKRTFSLASLHELHHSN